jgi:hypothetical protein
MGCWCIRFSADAGQEVVQFGPKNRHVLRCVDVESNLGSTDFDDGFLANANYSSRQKQRRKPM